MYRRSLSEKFSLILPLKLLFIKPYLHPPAGDSKQNYTSYPMPSFAINALSPLDGRYAAQTAELGNFFSEKALFKYRVRVEIEYFIAFTEVKESGLRPLTDTEQSWLRDLYLHFSEADALWIKEREKITNHDVKAVEYFIKDKLKNTPLAAFQEWIHFGLTSQDINNTALPLMLKEAMEAILLPPLGHLTGQLQKQAAEWWEVPMLARTHGQPASPTRMGKEMMVFAERLKNQTDRLKIIPYTAKFGGASGNFNAHYCAFPNVDWVVFANAFLKVKLGLKRQQYTTQIEHYDDMAAIFDTLKRIATILTDYARDMWTYIMLEYFGQKIKEGEIGSSAMPHKVNPIDFENAEGNLGIAIALFSHFAEKLPISRLQRDLTDSTVTRNIGVPLGHFLVALKSLNKGIDKLILNRQKLDEDLEQNWAVLAEAYQTILRREGIDQPYEKLKDLTRNGQKINRTVMHQFIAELHVTEEVKAELRSLTPQNYIGNLLCPVH